MLRATRTIGVHAAAATAATMMMMMMTVSVSCVRREFLFLYTVLNGWMQSARKRNDRLFEKLITPPPSTPCALRVRESEKNVLQSRIQTKPVCYFQIADKQRSERESLLSVFHSCYTLSLSPCV